MFYIYKVSLQQRQDILLFSELLNLITDMSCNGRDVVYLFRLEEKRRDCRSLGKGLWEAQSS